MHAQILMSALSEQARATPRLSAEIMRGRLHVLVIVGMWGMGWFAMLFRVPWSLLHSVLRLGGELCVYMLVYTCLECMFV